MQSLLTLKQVVHIITTVLYRVDDMKVIKESVSINIIFWSYV
jgi:hypothetical protein